MTLLRQLGALVRDTLAELRPDQIAWRVTCWTQSLHAPEETGVPDPPVVCMHCEAAWPCDEWVRLDAEMERLES